VSAPAITVEGLGKRYRIGTQARRTLREAVASAFRSRPATADDENELWALREVDFTVAPGEVLGVIGGNGAGKSTLLKILARITEPTCGRAVVRGRVGSLLEVGTGFHAELSGRDNIGLAGAVLGMSRREIAESFDAIIAFAEIDRFLDTPVKHYSSGMYMRLAFAVAAHLRPEILLVDEVLAVGDAGFQRKCLGKMAEVAGSGRTVLFTSHQLGAIRQLCARALWLDSGRIRQIGPAHDVVNAYLSSAHGGQDLGQVVAEANARDQDPDFRWDWLRVEQDGVSSAVVCNGSPARIGIGFTILRPAPDLRVLIDVLDEQHDLVFRTFHDDGDDEPGRLTPGRYRATAEIAADTLVDRPHWLLVQATIHNQRMIGRGIALRLDVQRTTPVNRAYPHEPLRGRVLGRVAWSLAAED